MSTGNDTEHPPLEIRSRFGVVLHTSQKATVREALEEAVAAGSNLRYSNLSYSNLSYSNLSGSDLSGSDLSGSDLSGSDLRGTTCLSVTGLPSGHAILAPLPEGWRLTIGCWNGTVPELRELIAKDTGWPEASGEQIAARRPMLTALADMCDAWTATNGIALQQVQDKWAPKVEVSA